MGTTARRLLGHRWAGIASRSTVHVDTMSFIADKMECSTRSVKPWNDIVLTRHSSDIRTLLLGWQEDTWTEVARRALQLFATALRVKSADASGGLDNWVGMPRHSDSHPLNCMDFATVLQVHTFCYQVTTRLPVLASLHTRWEKQ